MAKKNMQAADATLDQLKSAPVEAEKKNDTPFTVWTTKENAERWRLYQKTRKSVIKTQAQMIEEAMAEYMKNHPATTEEKEAVLKTLGLL